MVIENVLGNALVKCSWTDDSGNKVSANFNEATLTPIKPEVLFG